MTILEQRNAFLKRQLVVVEKSSRPNIMALFTAAEDHDLFTGLSRPEVATYVQKFVDAAPNALESKVLPRMLWRERGALPTSTPKVEAGAVATGNEAAEAAIMKVARSAKVKTPAPTAPPVEAKPKTKAPKKVASPAPRPPKAAAVMKMAGAVPGGVAATPEALAAAMMKMVAERRAALAAQPPNVSEIRWGGAIPRTGSVVGGQTALGRVTGSPALGMFGEAPVVAGEELAQGEMINMTNVPEALMYGGGVPAAAQSVSETLPKRGWFAKLMGKLKGGGKKGLSGGKGKITAAGDGAPAVLEGGKLTKWLGKHKGSIAATIPFLALMAAQYMLEEDRLRKQKKIMSEAQLETERGMIPTADDLVAEAMLQDVQQRRQARLGASGREYFAAQSQQQQMQMRDLQMQKLRAALQQNLLPGETPVMGM